MITSGFVEEAARAKVNLALHVTGKRKDGYHLIDSIVLFADICDRLRIAPASSNRLRVTGPHSASIDPGRSNLVLRAQEAMRAEFGRLIPDLDIVLEKHIPPAAGLGGGSADAAATLRALCGIAGLDPLSRPVRDIALSLGADVPVCLYSQASRIRGIGEIIDPLPGTTTLTVVLANPNIPLETAAVFEALGLNAGEPGYPPLELPFELANSRNDLTPAAVGILPAVDTLLHTLKGLPEVRFARMSGSGGTCFAVFDSLEAAVAAAAALAKAEPGWWVRTALLS